MQDPIYRPFEAPGDEAATRRILALAFGGPDEGVGEYLDLVDRASMRVVAEGNEPRACLARLPMGQMYGGRSVPMMGIAAVGVPPEARGSGRARLLMESGIREIAAEGVPLASLYASTQSLYRLSGFEQAGTKFDTVIPMRQLTEGTRDLPIEPVAVTDRRVRDCYGAFARRYDGNLDRSEFLWKRIARNRDLHANGFAVAPQGAGGPIEGYAFIAQTRRDGGRHDLVATDIAFSTTRAAERILGLIADFTSMALALTLRGGPVHPLVPFLRQQWLEVTLREYWMLRVVDMPAAIAARGYPRGVTADVPLFIEDDLIPRNAGHWRLRVSHGEGAMTRSDPSPAGVRLGPRGFAAIYSGFHAPAHAALLGLAQGDDAALAALAPCFANGGAWMGEGF